MSDKHINETMNILISCFIKNSKASATEIPQTCYCNIIHYAHPLTEVSTKYPTMLVRNNKDWLYFYKLISTDKWPYTSTSSFKPEILSKRLLGKAMVESHLQ
jgi:hypothetical protein